MAYGEGGEVGFGGGGSFYSERTATSPAGDGKVGFDNGFAVSGWVGHNMYQYLGGEIRYMYQQNDLKLDAGSGSAKFSGRTQAVNYNFHIHTAPKDSKVRPFLAVGGGLKGYAGTGTEIPNQPGADIVLLTKTTEWKGVIVFGGGIKYAVSDHVALRVEVYDYFSQVPTKVITPAPGGDLGGWFHNLVPSFGVSFTF